MRQLSISVTGVDVRIHGGFVVLTPPREVTWQNYPDVRDALCRALAGAERDHRTGVVVDFSRTVLLDASGLVLLARARTRAQLLGRQFRIVAPCGAVGIRQSLGNIGLTAMIAVYPSLAEATADPLEMDERVSIAHLSRILDTIRSTQRSRTLTPLDPPSAGLVIKVEDDSPSQAKVILDGVIDQGSSGRLGGALSSLVDSGRRHLVIDLSAKPVIRCDALSILNGIRWRVSAEGGCLTIASPPAVLRLMIRREGFDRVFRACGLTGCWKVRRRITAELA